jgi:glycosyltransferase involved in cell wall biosynthesis
LVDDGSKDNTPEVAEKFFASGKIRGRYIRKPNGGKHTALNLAVREARGSLFTVLDSDDWFEPRALERMKFYWDQVPGSEQPRFKGICGLFAYESGAVVGDKFPSDIFDSDDLDLQLRYNIKGDKIGFIRTEVMREFPFPEDLSHGVKGSIYVGESLVWNRMALKYANRFVNEVFAIKEYQPDGIMDSGRLLQARNAKAFLAYYEEMIRCGRRLPWRHALRSYRNYVRYSLHDGVPLSRQIDRAPKKLWLLMSYPIGWLTYVRDQRLTHEASSNRPVASRSIG